jgi:hypothetical protein
VAITEINVNKNILCFHLTNNYLLYMNTKFYVYQLKTSNGEIFYIGKGNGDRMYKHIRISKGNSINKSKNPKLYNKISNELRRGGYITPEILFESESENECLVKEIELISKIGKENLCNLTDGGEGTSGYKLSEETKRKMSLSKIGKKRIFTDEHKQHLSKSLTGKIGYWRGKKLSEETKRKMSENGKGKNKGPISKEHRQAIIDGIKKKKMLKSLSVSNN